MTSTTEVDELCSWLDQIPFSRQKKNMPRDFSDGVMMAELLKHFYPKLVELHNYSPANCLTHKINNWSTLHRKVLSKLGIKLQKQQLEQLASAAPDAIMSVLASVKNKIVDLMEKKKCSQQLETDQLTLLNGQQSLICLIKDGGSADSVLGIPLTCEPGSGQRLIIALESMVPKRLLDEKLAEIEEKDEAISIMVQKVSHLDRLLNLKDQRIKDLSQQLQVFKGRSKDSDKEESLSKTLTTFKSGT